MPPKTPPALAFWLGLILALPAIADEPPEPERPRLLDPIFKVADPSKIQRFFDDLVGFDSGEVSDPARSGRSSPSLCSSTSSVPWAT